MKLVVDANIIMSCLISGRDSDLLFSPHLDLYSPDLLFSELRKHKQEIVLKSSLSEAKIELLLILLEKQVNIISGNMFENLMLKAMKLLGEHKKDAPFIALALYLDCPFWTYEKRLAKLEEIEVITTPELRRKAGSFTA